MRDDPANWDGGIDPTPIPHYGIVATVIGLLLIGLAAYLIYR